MGPLAAAWERVRSAPRLILALALGNLLLTFAATRPLSAALANVIDHRPAASAMVRGNDALLGELLFDHFDLVTGGLGAAEAVLVLWGVLAWILAGGLLATLTRADAPRPTVTEVVAASAQHAWRMTRLGALGLLTRIVPLLIGGAVYLALKPLYAHKGFSQVSSWMLVTGLAFALAWGWATVAVDYARAIALAEPVKLHRALGRGIRRSLRGPTVSIVLFSLTGFAAITLVQAAIGHALPAEPGWAALLSFVVRIAAALGRTAVTLTALVAAGLAAQPVRATSSALVN